MTDIHTTWVETGALLGKGQERVQQALDRLATALPFPLRGIDSDNGSEFINAHLVRYCQARNIQFTRGRPDKKDDNAHIEQKNWTHVRKLVDYVRYDSAAALNVLYADLRLWQNLWLPSVKLVRRRVSAAACGDSTAPHNAPRARANVPAGGSGEGGGAGAHPLDHRSLRARGADRHPTVPPPVVLAITGPNTDSAKEGHPLSL